MVTPYNVTYDGNPHTATCVDHRRERRERGGRRHRHAERRDAHGNAGTYSDSWSFAGGPNYNDIASTPITNVIAKAASAVVVTIDGGPFTYTGLAQTPATVTVTGAGGLSLTPTASYANNVNAGTATASYAYAGDANHEAGSGSATFAIGKATAAVVVTPYAVTYDGSPHAATVHDRRRERRGRRRGRHGHPRAPTAHQRRHVQRLLELRRRPPTTTTSPPRRSPTSSARHASAVVVTINGGPFTYTGLAQTPAAVSVTARAA